MKHAAFVLSVTVGICALASSGARAFETTLEVPSRTLTDNEVVEGNVDTGTPVKLNGSLVGPDSEARLPVVILLHGADGPRSGAVWNWSRFLNSAGVATLSLDSYSGRGFRRAPSNASFFGQFFQIVDAYRAVDVLAAHPKIDGSRIAIMGFSRGGNAALYSAMTRFQKAFGPSEGRIVAHLAFYPYCIFQFDDQPNVSSAPIREFHGASDDLTPTEPCQYYIDRLEGAGHDARMTVYPGALHGFDDPRNPARYSDSEWPTARHCRLRELDGELLNTSTGQSFTYADTCVEYGASVQYNDAATTAAQVAVKALLAKVFAER